MSAEDEEVVVWVFPNFEDAEYEVTWIFDRGTGTVIGWTVTIPHRHLRNGVLQYSGSEIITKETGFELGVYPLPEGITVEVLGHMELLVSAPKPFRVTLIYV